MSDLQDLGIDESLFQKSAPDNWLSIQKQLPVETPFETYEKIYQRCFANAQSPAVAWRPSEMEIQSSHIHRWIEKLNLSSFNDLFQYSTTEREEFWRQVIEDLKIPFKKEPDSILSMKGNTPTWLGGARLNIVDSCFQAPTDRTAIVYQTPDGVQQISYGELRNLTNRISNGLVAAGYSKGDAIAIDMPMTMESVAIYLGIIQAGCVVVSIADSFAPDEIAIRLKISSAKAIFTQGFVNRAGKRLPLYEKVRAAGAERTILLGDTEGLELRETDRLWEDFLPANSHFESIGCSPQDASNILFSSGTTGDPKAIPWDHTTAIKAAADGMFHQDIHRGDIVAWPTNLGWMMGPWLIYASLINQSTMALSHHTPASLEFGQFVADNKVTMLGIVPSIVKSWRDSKAMESLDWSSIKCFSSTGEASNPSDYLYLMYLAGFRPIIEYCGGTEIGGGYATGTVVQDCSPSTFSTPALGLDLVVLDENGNEASQGELFIVPPSIGLSTRLLNRDHEEIYFAQTSSHRGVQLRRHGDQIEKLSNGYYRALGRADDTMNLGGIKTSSAEIERVCNDVQGVVETAAIAVPPPGGGPDRLIVYAVGNEIEGTQLKSEFQAQIKSRLNPLFKVSDVVIVEKLPRTASNKVMRRVLRQEYMS